jgi:hypothetical protein
MHSYPLLYTILLLIDDVIGYDGNSVMLLPVGCSSSVDWFACLVSAICIYHGGLVLYEYGSTHVPIRQLRGCAMALRDAAIEPNDKPMAESVRNDVFSIYVNQLIS